MIHLTETGPNAGRTFCLIPRDPAGQYAHGAYAPLNKPEYRANCCPDCLRVWALEAFEPGDEMPDWVTETRAKG